MSAHAFDVAEVVTALATLLRPGDVFELRIETETHGTVGGFFDDFEAAGREVKRYDRKGKIYVTLNPVHPDLLLRFHKNRLHTFRKNNDLTKDEDILRRRWILLDSDAKRKAGISATEAELAAAKTVADSVVESLRALGWDGCVVAMSGNGYHILVPVDLPNDEPTRILVKRFLAATAARHNTPGAQIDPAVYNAARISKVYGTLACKGVEMAERPHRRAALIRVPERSEPAPRELLEKAIAAWDTRLAAEQTTAEPPETDFEAIRHEFDARGLYLRERGSGAHDVTCPWVAEHSEDPRGDSETVLFEPSDKNHGRGAFHCSHAHSNGRPPEGGYKLRDVRVAFGLAAPPGSAEAIHKAFREAALNDDGNSQRFAAVYGRRVRYDESRDVWLIWKDTIWQPDESGEIYRLAKKVIRRFRHYAADLVESAGGKELLKFAIASGSRRRIEDMLALAGHEDDIAVTAQRLDADPYLFNVENGVLDLRTGTLRGHLQTDLITKKARVRFDPSATCPGWTTFLRRCMGGDETLVHYLQLFMGCCLIGRGGVKAFTVHHGSGDNGKSTFLNTMALLFGDYARSINIKTLLAASAYEGGGQHRDDLAQLPGARFVFAGEPPKGAKLDVSLLKQLTGGDPITTRAAYGKTFTFTPVCKISLATNERPIVTEDTRAIWDRLKPVPWEVVIPAEERIENYHEILARELPGILNWALAGCLEWQRVGLKQEPEKISEDRAEYREAMDGFTEWVSQWVVLDPSAVTSSSDLFKCYSAWAKREKIPQPLNPVHFGRRLPSLPGIAPDKSHKSRSWQGLRLELRRNPGTVKPPLPDSSIEKSAYGDQMENGAFTVPTVPLPSPATQSAYRWAPFAPELRDEKEI